jgi:hypothetical protein
MGYQINQNIILTGDLNSDLFTSHNNKLIDTMNLFNLTNVIEKPTRVTEHSSTLLDPIIISDSIHYSFSDVLKVPSDISDHDASIIFIECPKRIRSRFLISLLSSLLNHGRSLLRIVTIVVGMHSLATLRNVPVKVLHISSTSWEWESNAFQSTVSSLLAIFSLSVRSYNQSCLKYIQRRTGLGWGRQTIPESQRTRDETFAIWDSITKG